MSDESVAQHCSETDAVHVELEAGEVALLHNWTMHRSDVNRSEIARRAFSVCYTDARTKHPDGATYPVIFGEDALKVDELAAARP